ncbi:MAG: 5,6-dimethylbenzimidazole synthase [Chitinophagales bacterium]|jgi:5,6-dimethylbenzimidazole synthase
MTKITEQEKQGFNRVLYNRRDIRSDFLPDSVDENVLMDILTAAHHAPSVGFSQPWNFIVIKDDKVKQDVYQAFTQANLEAREMFDDQRKDLYQSLKLQGILDAPINICITCDRSRGGEVVLGKTHQPDMDLYSTVCAVQNLWLAARAENIGVGWVSIIKRETLSHILKLPDEVVPVAYLCVGHVSSFSEIPELESKRWEQRQLLKNLVYADQWGSK